MREDRNKLQIGKTRELALDYMCVHVGVHTYMFVCIFAHMKETQR